MNTDLCVGIYSNKETLEMAALESGKSAVFMNFPATAVGVDAIKGYLAGYKSSIRLAVSGVADLNLALTLGNLSGRETFIVSCAVANQAIALAHYAENTA
jgi:hypothetical protein